MPFHHAEARTPNLETLHSAKALPHFISMLFERIWNLRTTNLIERKKLGCFSNFVLIQIKFHFLYCSFKNILGED
jgi:hypothetical protein